VVRLHRQPPLLELVGARRPASGLTSRLQRRQKQADERANDGDHDQQFDQRKTV
jgi:hypothetical protein